MSRVAIIGSCITRDVWPILGETPQDLLYISRTSLPSLFAPPIRDVETAAEPPPPLNPQPHSALVADLTKTALASLEAHAPTHIIFDFIDERFDLLASGGGLATHTWEMDVSGYLARPALAGADTIPRLSPACDALWDSAAIEMASWLKATGLRDSTLILHSARWANRYVDLQGQAHDLPDETTILEGRTALRSRHNALLARYDTAFLQAVPGLRVAQAADHHVADEGHRWGLSPFHYVEAYYRAIWEQFRAAGV